MLRVTTNRSFVSYYLGLRATRTLIRANTRIGSRRQFQTAPNDILKSIAFAFDIDGVLLRSSKPLSEAHKTLSFLQEKRIPFILLTNGGGRTEHDRARQLSELLNVPIDYHQVVQSHTPFKGLYGLKNKRVLVVGGDRDKCRRIAHQYGFQHVYTPGDLLVAYPDMWPFADPDRYRSYTRPLEEIGKGHLLSPRNLTEAQNRAELIKIDGILVFNDPRDWALDIQIILDLLLSEEGYLGSISPKNGDDSLDNRGYHQHEQPKIWFSNPDLSWAAAYHIPRLGQGSFKRALFGLWTSISQKDAHKVKILHKQYGKPSDRMFQYGENMLLWYRAQLLHAPSINPVEAKQSTHNKTAGLVEGVLGQPLKHIYMVGDNPESDVLGANSIRSKNGVGWHSVLVRTGVYESGTPAHTPNAIVDNVWDAVQWSIEDVKTATSRNAGSEGALGEKIAAPESRV